MVPYWFYFLTPGHGYSFDRLNPLRANLVGDINGLDSFAYSGHGTLIGKLKNEWQNTEYILANFGKTVSKARQQYREFVQQGLDMGKRPELTGGGLIRSLGGWTAAKKSRTKMVRIKGDERILGGSDFVEEVLRLSEEKFNRRYQLQLAGYNLDKLAKEVAALFDIEPERIFKPGKYPRIVQARSLFCYWSIRELGLTATALAKKLNLTQPAVSIAGKR